MRANGEETTRSCGHLRFTHLREATSEELRVASGAVGAAEAPGQPTVETLMNEFRSNLRDLGEHTAFKLLHGRVVSMLSRGTALEEQEWADRPDEWTDRIKAVHPMNTGKHEVYATAMKMVGNRHGKFSLVALVNWLLMERRPSR